MEGRKATAGEAESASARLLLPPTQCAMREADAERLFLFQSLDTGEGAFSSPFPPRPE